MFSREINWSEGFPNMVLSTEYSEAVNARYTFQPLWVSDGIQNKDKSNEGEGRVYLKKFLNVLIKVGILSFYQKNAI